MYYLDTSSFNKYQTKFTRIFTHINLDKDLSESIKLTIEKDIINAKEEKQFCIIKEKNNKSFITKSSTFRHRNNIIRATLGIKRRGAYDLQIAEIDNHLKLYHLEYIPNILGFGFKNNRFGAITSVSITIEFKDNTYNVREFIEKFPNRIESVLISSFNLIKKHLKDDIIHLDLWTDNILINESLTKSWIIDLEVLKYSPKGSFEKKLGHCLGYLYRNKLLNYIAKDKYDYSTFGVVSKVAEKEIYRE